MREWTDFAIIKRRSDQIRCSPHQDTMKKKVKHNNKNNKTKNKSFRILRKSTQVLGNFLFISDRVKRGESLCQIFLCYFFCVDLFVSCHAETTPAAVLQEFVAPPQLRDAACPPCASCTLTFSPNLLAALPHFITPPCGLSLIITYWFFIAVTAARACMWGLIWMGGRGWASRKPTRAAFDSNKVRRINRLWSETCKEKTRIVHRRGRLFRRHAWMRLSSGPPQDHT